MCCIAVLTDQTAVGLINQRVHSERGGESTEKQGTRWCNCCLVRYQIPVQRAVYDVGEWGT